MTGMLFDPTRYHRRSIRLKGYDYRLPGAYFVTLVSYQRACLFGEIENGRVTLTPAGKIVDRCWRAIPSHFTLTRFDIYIIMPNHLHGILFLETPRTGEASVREPSIVLAQTQFSKKDTSSKTGTDASPQPKGTLSQSLGAIIQNFKSTSTRRTNQLLLNPGSTLWQRNYYEHIIRNEEELNAIRKYILDNPLKWEHDRERPHKGEVST